MAGKEEQVVGLPRVRRGFSLVEMLVVVAVLAVLLALLMPTLSRARQAANTAACLANLRGIGQALHSYLAENRGYIPGSGNTSGRHLWRAQGTGPAMQCVPADPAWTIGNCPGPNECNDYVYPLARAMGLRSAELDGTDGVARFRWYLSLPQFRCPAAGGPPATPDPSGDVSLGAVETLSYLTAMAFLNVAWERYPVNFSNGFQGNVCLLPPPSASGSCWTAPEGYAPLIGRVGNLSEKIYMADGVRRIRYANNTGSWIIGPVYVLDVDPRNTYTVRSIYSDYGAFYGESAAWQRQAVPGNASLTPAVDARVYSYPHGLRTPWGAAGQYRLNCLFFDGHARTLDEVAAADPNLWLPAGTRLNRPTNGIGGNNPIPGVKVVWTDAQQRYLPGAWPAGSYHLVP